MTTSLNVNLDTAVGHPKSTSQEEIAFLATIITLRVSVLRLCRFQSQRHMMNPKLIIVWLVLALACHLTSTIFWLTPTHSQRQNTS
jgi:hypothetical protein